MNLKIFPNKTTKFYKNNTNNISFLGLIFIALLTCLIFNAFSSKNKKKKSSAKTLEVFEASTLIPYGYTLIPIEVENFEAVNGLIRKFAWVNLYTPEKRQGKWRKSIQIVKKVRILRAPLDPNHFGIMVPEDYSQKIMAYGSVFKVSIIKNAQGKKSELVAHDKASKQRIFFDH